MERGKRDSGVSLRIDAERRSSQTALPHTARPSDAKKFLKVAVCSDGSGHADERFILPGQIPVHLMPGRVQVIHVPESEKDL